MELNVYSSFFEVPTLTFIQRCYQQSHRFVLSGRENSFAFLLYFWFWTNDLYFFCGSLVYWPKRACKLIMCGLSQHLFFWILKVFICFFCQWKYCLILSQCCGGVVVSVLTIYQNALYSIPSWSEIDQHLESTQPQEKGTQEFPYKTKAGRHWIP